MAQRRQASTARLAGGRISRWSHARLASIRRLNVRRLLPRLGRESSAPSAKCKPLVPYPLPYLGIASFTTLATDGPRRWPSRCPLPEAAFASSVGNSAHLERARALSAKLRRELETSREGRVDAATIFRNRRDPQSHTPSGRHATNTTDRHARFTSSLGSKSSPAAAGDL
jgi:hypothetical protein